MRLTKKISDVLCQHASLWLHRSINRSTLCILQIYICNPMTVHSSPSFHKNFSERGKWSDLICFGLFFAERPHLILMMGCAGFRPSISVPVPPVCTLKANLRGRCVVFCVDLWRHRFEIGSRSVRLFEIPQKKKREKEREIYAEPPRMPHSLGGVLDSREWGHLATKEFWGL